MKYGAFSRKGTRWELEYSRQMCSVAVLIMCGKILEGRHRGASSFALLRLMIVALRFRDRTAKYASRKRTTLRYFNIKQGIEQCLTCPDTPEQNGVTEKANRHIVELARLVLSVSKMSKSFWAHACETTTFLVNRTGKSTISGKTPFQFGTGKSFSSFNYFANFRPRMLYLHSLNSINEQDGYKV